MLKDYMTVDDMLNYFDISRNTLVSWEKKGLLRIEPSQRKILYSKADIESFLDSQKFCVYKM